MGLIARGLTVIARAEGEGYNSQPEGNSSHITRLIMRLLVNRIPRK